jgi:hypothetical protein
MTKSSDKEITKKPKSTTASTKKEITKSTAKTTSKTKAAPKEKSKDTKASIASTAASAKVTKASDKSQSTKQVTTKNPNKKEVTKAAIPTFSKKTLTLIAAGLLIACIVVLGLVGYFGYRVYQNYNQTGTLVERINIIDQDFQPVEDNYESLLTLIDGYDTTQYPEDQSNNITAKISEINSGLDNFSKTLDKQKSPELDGYVAALQDYNKNLQAINDSVTTMVGYAGCYASFDTSTSSLGQQFSTVNQENADDVVSLYQGLLNSTKTLNGCIQSIGKGDFGSLSNLISDLEKSTSVVIEGIKDNSLTQDQLNQFLDLSVNLQKESLKYAESITTSLESEIKKADQSLVRIDEEKQYLSDNYDIVFAEDESTE